MFVTNPNLKEFIMTNEQATASVDAETGCTCIDCTCAPCSCDTAKRACGCAED